MSPLRARESPLLARAYSSSLKARACACPANSNRLPCLLAVGGPRLLTSRARAAKIVHRQFYAQSGRPLRRGLGFRPRSGCSSPQWHALDKVICSVYSGSSSLLATTIAFPEEQESCSFLVCLQQQQLSGSVHGRVFGPEDCECVVRVDEWPRALVHCRVHPKQRFACATQCFAFGNAPQRNVFSSCLSSTKRSFDDPLWSKAIIRASSISYASIQTLLGRP